MDNEDLIKAFRLGIIMAETAYGVERVGTTKALWKCLGYLQEVANGDSTTIASWEEIIPHKSGEPVVRDEVMIKVERENRAAERRIAAAILSKFARPTDGENPDRGTAPG